MGTRDENKVVSGSRMLLFSLLILSSKSVYFSLHDFGLFAQLFLTPNTKHSSIEPYVTMCVDTSAHAQRSLFGGGEQSWLWHSSYDLIM